jgi:N-acetylglucosamine kinase-like BadF-type ATPase
VIFLSIDGGASHTRGVLFTDTGEVKRHLETEATSLSRTDIDASRILGEFIQELVNGAGLELDEIGLISVGVAGVSNLDARERLFKELDRMRLTERAIVTSDVEAAYETVWGELPGALVCVGTGAIGWARDERGNSYRASGRGPQMGGDPGSGFWMGKTALVHLIMNEQVEDDHLDKLKDRIINTYDVDTIEDAARKAGEPEHMVSRTAQLGQVICELAEQQNDVALAIVQEGTQSLADDLLHMIEEAGLREDRMIIGMNGSVIVNNAIFRKTLTDALNYDIPDITWKPPEIDPVFGAGLIAARLNGIPLDMAQLTSNWRKHRLRT